MSFHWKVLLWMAAGALVGLLMQTFLPAPAYSGLQVVGAEGAGSVMVTGVSKGSPGAKAELTPGQSFEAAVVARGSEDERRVNLTSPSDLDEGVVQTLSNGEVFWLVPAGNAAASSGSESVSASVTKNLN